MSKLRTLLAVVVLALGLSACGGDDDPLGVNSGDPLTQDEIQAVFFALSEVFASLNDAPAAGPARATVAVSETFSASAPCPNGGTISANGSANGTVDDVTFELDLTYRLRLTPSGCVVETESAVVTLESSPYIQLDMDFLLTETLLEASGSQTGGIAFTSSDGRSGSCAFDVQFSTTANLDTQQGSSSTSGTVCGVSASGLQVWSYDAGP